MNSETSGLFDTIGVLWIDHVAVTTNRFDETVRDFLSIPGARLMRGPGWNPDQKVHFAFVQFAGDMMTEVLGLPEDGDSPIAHHVQSGGGAYHLCYAVADLDVSLDRAKIEGAKLVVEARSDTAYDGRRVAFMMHPAHGIFELVDAYGTTGITPNSAMRGGTRKAARSATTKADSSDIVTGLNAVFSAIMPSLPEHEYAEAEVGSPGWDSLAQLRLIMHLETEFDVNVASEQFSELTSYAKLRAYLEETQG